MNKGITYLLFLIITIFFICNATFSQESDSTVVGIFDLSLRELMELEITTAAKTKQSYSDAPTTMIVITDEMIKNRGYHYLEEILHDLPGFDFNKSYGVNYSTIFMRGYRSENSDRFLLMFDGILENDIWKQTTWISRQYPVGHIKQIEVLYGPASVLYGTNAFSGIINVITKKGSEIGDINLITTAGSWGRKNIEFQSGETFLNGNSYNVAIKYFSQDDLHQWDDFDVITGNCCNFSADYLRKIGDEFVFAIDGELVNEDFNQPHPGENYGLHANFKYGDLSFTILNWTKKELESYFYSPFKRSGPWTQWFENNQGYMLSLNKEINRKISLSTDITYRNHRILDSKEVGFIFYDKPLTNPSDFDYQHSQTIVHNDPSTYQLRPIPVTLDNEEDTFVTGIVYYNCLGTWDMAIDEQITYLLTDKLQLIGGFRYTYTNTQENYEISVCSYSSQSAPRHIKKNISGYALAIYKPFTGLNISIGGRYEDQKNEDNVGYNIFIPRFSVNYKFSKNVIIRFQYAEAFQEADDWHKFGTDFDLRPYNSADLEPEKLRSFDLGATVNLKNRLLISGTAYYTIVSNFITEVDNDSLNPYHGYTTGIHFENLSSGEVTIYGYEFNFNLKLSSSFSLNGNVSGAFNYDFNNVLIGDIAPVKIYMGALYNYQNKISLYTKINYVSSKKTINWQENPNIDPIYTNIDEFLILGINLNIIDMLGYVNGLDFNIKVDNLLNKEYYNPGPRSADGVKYNARVLQPGFNIMVGLTYTF